MPTLELQNKENINYMEWNPQAQKNIIFVHGNFSSLYWWLDIINLINQKEKFHIIAIDQRGFGKSTYNHFASRFAEWAEDLVDFCKLKKLQKVTLVGWSFGGAISMKTAEIAPELVQSIVLTASVSHKGLVMKDQHGNYVNKKQQLQKMPHFQMTLNSLKDKNVQVMNNIFEIGLFQKMPNYPQQKKKLLVNSSFEQASYMDILVALTNSDINIEKIKAKVLMIHGKEDLIIKLDSVKETGQILKGLQIWQENAHMLPLQNSERYVERVIQFFKAKN